jgi:hypothetical protein
MVQETSEAIQVGDSRENSRRGASLSRIRAEMLMRDEPAAIDPAQNGGAASAAGGFSAADEALPAKLVVAGGHLIGDDGPRDVAEAENFVFEIGERGDKFQGKAEGMPTVPSRTFKTLLNRDATKPGQPCEMDLARGESY